MRDALINEEWRKGDPLICGTKIGRWEIHMLVKEGKRTQIGSKSGLF